MAITFKSVLASGGSGSGAVITVTYSAEFYNQTLTATNGTDTVTALATSAGTVDITVPSAGSWVVSCTISGETYTSETVSVDLSYSTELVVIPDGSTVTPTDDVQTWLKCAGIKDKAYTTLSEVLADSVTFNALLGDSNACAYMARSTTWSATLCADQYAMSMIGQYDVCCDALLGNATWASAIVNSAYADYVLNRNIIPVMTSYTAPSGTIVYSGYYNAPRNPVCPFDSNNRNVWQARDNTTGEYIGYTFDSAVSKIDYIELECGEITANNGRTYNFTIQSYDGSSWTDVDTWSVTVSKKGWDFAGDVITEAPDVFVKKVNLLNVRGVRVISKTEALYVSGSYCIVTTGFKAIAFGTEKIHGTTNESAYYLDGATEVAIADPSTLPSGTYTFGSTVAKDPSDLTADYTKTIRITPNTVEVVLRPDCALYWWGYEGSNLEVVNTANGWSRSGMSLNSPTFNVNSISCTSSSSSNSQNVGLKTSAYGINNLYVIATGVTAYNGNYGYMILNNTKTWSSTSAIKSEYITGITQTKYTFSCEQATANSYLFVGAGWSMACTLYAIWTD